MPLSIFLTCDLELGLCPYAYVGSICGSTRAHHACADAPAIDRRLWRTAGEPVTKNNFLQREARTGEKWPTIRVHMLSRN
jgi:hypothetical protein